MRWDRVTCRVTWKW